MEKTPKDRRGGQGKPSNSQPPYQSWVSAGLRSGPVLPSPSPRRSWGPRGHAVLGALGLFVPCPQPAAASASKGKECLHRQPGSRLSAPPATPAGIWRAGARGARTNKLTFFRQNPSFSRDELYTVALRILLWVWMRAALAFSGGVQLVKNPSANAGDVRDMGQEGPLEKEMTTYSSVLAWKISWTEKLVGYTP